MAYYILKSYKLKVDPFKIFAVLKDEQYCFFLDSSLNSNSLGRYSFVGIEPFYILESKNPFLKLREIFGKYKISLTKNELPFLGGAVGYLSYDLDRADSFFGFYNTLIIIDHFKKLLSLFAVGFPEKNHHLQKLLCASNFKKICKLLSRINLPEESSEKLFFNTNSHESKAKFSQIINRKYSCEFDKNSCGFVLLKSNFTKEDYILAIKKAKEYIRIGDIYQVNLSQEFQAKTELSGFEIYKRLRKISPSCFSAYLDGENFQVLSSSPERFLRLEGNRVVTRPMKGTRPRSKNRLQDLKLKRELLESAKDKAELTMIVDLERNDLGRVCDYDSVKVNTLRELEEYSTVFQTTATISGRLHKDKDRFDLLQACFPGGSITGCPKIRAMEIIEELEPNRRNVYTGCLGYLSFSGNMDFNILIRTILKKSQQLYFGVGGGIVADSDPDGEYRETLVKAKAMREAIAV